MEYGKAFRLGEVVNLAPVSSVSIEELSDFLSTPQKIIRKGKTRRVSSN